MISRLLCWFGWHHIQTSFGEDDQFGRPTLVAYCCRPHCNLVEDWTWTLENGVLKPNVVKGTITNI